MPTRDAAQRNGHDVPAHAHVPFAPLVQPDLWQAWVAEETTMVDVSKDKPRVVHRSTFQADLDALRIHTREGDSIAAARRRLPVVEVDGAAYLTREEAA